MQFFAYLENYTVVPEDEQKLYERRSSSITNPASRREVKINQYKKEKDLRARIQVCYYGYYLSTWNNFQCSSKVIRKRRGQLPTSEDSTPSDFDLILSLLPSSKSSDEDDEDDSQTDEVLREAILLLLRLFFVQAHNQSESLEQEFELLRSAPLPPSPQLTEEQDPRRSKQRKEEQDMWKLDAPVAAGGDGKGPLLDPSGKVRVLTLELTTRLPIV